MDPTFKIGGIFKETVGNCEIVTKTNGALEGDFHLSSGFVATGMLYQGR
jgi:hypothetical protein